MSGTMEFDSCHAAGNGGAVLAARSFQEGATREQSVPNSAKLRHLAVAFLEGFPLKPTTTRRTPVFPWPLRSGRRRVKFRIANGLFCPPSSGKALQFGTPNQSTCRRMLRGQLILFKVLRVSIDRETKKKKHPRDPEFKESHVEAVPIPGQIIEDHAKQGEPVFYTVCRSRSGFLMRLAVLNICTRLSDKK